MEKLFKKIYDTIIYEKDAVKMDRCVNEEIEDEVKEYESVLTEHQKEQLHTLVSSITATAEYEGFWLGVKYAYRFFRLLQ